MKFQTPQFIEVEDKIFGPLTLKQFIYLVGTGGAIFLVYNFLPGFFAVLVALPIAGLGVALAFYKINNKSFIEIIEAGFLYYAGGKLYTWKKEAPKPSAVKNEPKTKQRKTLTVPKLSSSKLKDLAWSLDIQSRQEVTPEETLSKEEENTV